MRASDLLKTGSWWRRPLGFILPMGLESHSHGKHWSLWCSTNKLRQYCDLTLVARSCYFQRISVSKSTRSSPEFEVVTFVFLSDAPRRRDLLLLMSFWKA